MSQSAARGGGAGGGGGETKNECRSVGTMSRSAAAGLERDGGGKRGCDSQGSELEMAETQEIGYVKLPVCTGR